MRVDVLDLHGGFVDQDAHGERKTTESHDVDRLAGHPQTHYRRENRERNRDHDNQSTSQVAKEDQHHQPSQNRAQQRFPDQAVERSNDVARLVEDEIDLDVLRCDIAHRRQSLTHVSDHIQRGRVGPFGDRNVDRTLVVDVREPDNDVGCVGDRADIPQVHGRPCPDAKRRVEQFLNVAAERGVRRGNTNEVAGPNVPRWQHRRGPIHRVDDFVWRQSILPKLLGVDAYDDRALTAAKRRWRGHARQRGKNGAHAVERDVLHFGHASRGARKHQLRDRNTARIEPHDERRHGARWHEGPRAVDVPDHFTHRLTHVGVGVKHQLHQRDALNVLRLDVFDARDVEEVILVVVRQVPFHLRRIHTAVRLRDVDSRCAELRENIHLHLPNRHDRGECDGNHRHEYGDRPAHGREH